VIQMNVVLPVLSSQSHSSSKRQWSLLIGRSNQWPHKPCKIAVCYSAQICDFRANL
jgi:hypothetical protein